MAPQEIITAFITLFVIIDPVGLSPLFAGLTQGQSTRQRWRIALRAIAVAFVLLTFFGLMGDQVLKFLGISMPAFRIAGGLLLFLTALEMLFDKRAKRREQHQEHPENQPVDDPSVFPLAMPLLAGPGSITSVILLMESTQGAQEFLVIEAVLLCVFAIAFVLFSLTSVLERVLGATGISVVTKIMGMLLAALSVQFVIDGLQSAFF